MRLLNADRVRPCLFFFFSTRQRRSTIDLGARRFPIGRSVFKVHVYVLRWRRYVHEKIRPEMTSRMKNYFGNTSFWPEKKKFLKKHHLLTNLKTPWKKTTRIKCIKTHTYGVYIYCCAGARRGPRGSMTSCDSGQWKWTGWKGKPGIKVTRILLLWHLIRHNMFE